MPEMCRALTEITFEIHSVLKLCFNCTAFWNMYYSQKAYHLQSLLLHSQVSSWYLFHSKPFIFTLKQYFCSIQYTFFTERVMRLRMFAKDQGSWLTMAATTVLVVFITSWIYNLIILAGGESMEPYKLVFSLLYQEPNEKIFSS